MEFLKSVAAVSGRLVTSVILSLPSGHMALSTGLELEEKQINGYTSAEQEETGRAELFNSFDDPRHEKHAF